ncbi:MAG TPA: hypothetical protein VEW48_18715 [Thermoanaerobaculia bacterium]|nr:hypothetical protein [Thermoanaerobaculia bacterium]
MPNPEHQQAQDLAASAELAMARGDSETARNLYARAADLELEGFRQLSRNEPRSRGILAVSYAALLFKAKLYDRAEVAICGLLADPGIPPEFRDELRDLLQVTWDERLLESERLRDSGAELTVALRGGTIGAGTAPAEVAAHYLSGFNLLFSRIAEHEIGDPLRRQGPSPPAIQNLFHARATQASAGSYRFTLKILEPVLEEGQQGSDAHRVSRRALEVLQAVAHNDQAALAEAVPDGSYRLALARLIRNVVPAGDALAEVEVRTENDGPLEAVRLVPEDRWTVNETIRALRALPEQSEIREETIAGTLRAVHLDQHWIRVVPNEGPPVEVSTTSEDLGDVIGPMVNRKVVARISRSGRSERSRPQLLDLELLED